MELHTQLAVLQVMQLARLLQMFAAVCRCLASLP